MVWRELVIIPNKNTQQKVPSGQQKVPSGTITFLVNDTRQKVPSGQQKVPSGKLFRSWGNECTNKKSQVANKKSQVANRVANTRIHSLATSVWDLPHQSPLTFTLFCFSNSIYLSTGLILSLFQIGIHPGCECAWFPDTDLTTIPANSKVERQTRLCSAQRVEVAMS